MNRAGVLLLGLALLALPSVVRADRVDYAPAAAVALGTGASVLVAWTAGTQAAEAYNVYGLPDAAPPVLLGTFVVEDPQTASDGILVPSGYEAYGVSGVAEPGESPMTMATMTAPPCVYVQPPYVAVNCGLPITVPVSPPPVPWRHLPVPGMEHFLHVV